MQSSSIPTKYSESRTLSRNLHRTRNQSRQDFKQNVLKLRKHFESFNLDVSELCQWLMGIRPEGKRTCPETEVLWHFFLTPLPEGSQGEDEADRCRRIAFDAISGIADIAQIENVKPTPEFAKAARHVSTLQRSRTTELLFSRLKGYGATHRQILLKSAADYIIAHYQRGIENWTRQHEAWAQEKNEWEKASPELTPQICERLNKIFSKLEIRDKRPKVCGWDILKESRDDCKYAGVFAKKHYHSALCIKFDKFKKTLRGKSLEYFITDLSRYLSGKRPGQGPFWTNLKKYLSIMEISEDTLRGWRKFPYCQTMSDTTSCSFNKHTDKCIQYKDLLRQEKDLQPLEAKYRDWRRDYLSGPQKPSFKYPSAHTLPMPKIFGAGFYKIDFARSIVSLRLEDMAEGEFIDFAFRPWPQKYSPTPEQAHISSVHVSFTGTQARVAFRFDIRHNESRFGITQDELDKLRRQKYPRRTQDQLFLDEARDLLLKSFHGDENSRKPRIMTVDLGTSGGYAAFYEGETFTGTESLKNIKMDKILDRLPTDKKTSKELGLTPHHVGMHLTALAKKACIITAKRPAKKQKSTLGKQDLRRLFLHVRWMIRDWVRLNTAEIIRLAESRNIDLIVFESMRGFSAPGRDKIDPEKKRRVGFFAAGSIRYKTTEKAVERGMRVITEPYLKSSRICSKCGKEQNDTTTFDKNKRKHLFICENKNCAEKMNSDENAAKVLGMVFWNKIKLPTDVDTKRKTI